MKRLRDARNIEELFDLLQQRGERVTRAVIGASDAALDEAERRIGMPLPPTYRSFARKYDWVDLRLAKVLGVGADAAHLDLPKQLDVVQRFVDRIVAINPDAEPQAEVLRKLVPAAAMGGNTIPHGYAISFDASGLFFMTSHKEFSSCEVAVPLEPQPESFESLFVQKAADAFSGYEDEYDDEEEDGSAQ